MNMVGKKQERLQIPDQCSPKLRKLIERCWASVTGLFFVVYFSQYLFLLCFFMLFVKLSGRGKIFDMPIQLILFLLLFSLESDFFVLFFSLLCPLFYMCTFIFSNSLIFFFVFCSQYSISYFMFEFNIWVIFLINPFLFLSKFSFDNWTKDERPVFADIIPDLRLCIVEASIL
jgi:hypothetical protein